MTTFREWLRVTVFSPRPCGLVHMHVYFFAGWGCGGDPHSVGEPDVPVENNRTCHELHPDIYKIGTPG